MKFQEAFKYLLSPLQSMPALKRSSSGEKPWVSGLLPIWQVKTFKALQVLPSLTDTILQSVLWSYAKFSLASNTMLFQAHVVHVFCIYFGTSSLEALENTHYSQATDLQVWNVTTWCVLLMGAAQDVTTVCSTNFSYWRPPEGEVGKCSRKVSWWMLPS